MFDQKVQRLTILIAVHILSNIFKRRYDIFLARKSTITNRHLLNRKTFSTRGFRFDSIAARVSRKRGNNFISSTFGCFFREFAIFFVNSTSGEKKRKRAAFISTGNRSGRLGFRPFVASPVARFVVKQGHAVRKERGWSRNGDEMDKNC